MHSITDEIFCAENTESTCSFSKIHVVVNRALSNIVASLRLEAYHIVQGLHRSQESEGASRGPEYQRNKRVSFCVQTKTALWTTLASPHCWGAHSCIIHCYA